MIWPSSFTFQVAKQNGLRRGVTLLELLIVVLVVAIIVVLVVPLYKGAVNRGETARCVANLRQLGTGIALYAAEHNGTLPPRKFLDTLPSGALQDRPPGNYYRWPQDPPTWPYQYIDSQWSTLSKIFSCPADKNKIRNPSGYSSYTVNFLFFMEFHTDGRPVSSYPLSGPNRDGRYIRLAEAQKKILMVDGIDMEEAKSWTGGNPQPNPNQFGCAGTLTADNGYRTLSSRHHGGANCLFGDGSVQWMQRNDPSLYDVIWREEP